MASDPESRTPQPRRKRIPLGSSRRRLSFERQLRLWLHLMALPTVVLSAILMRGESIPVLVAVLLCEIAVWALIVSVLMETIVRPLQTLTNVIASLREDDYSFRARGARRNDAMGDLAIEVNTLAAMLQSQRSGALEAMALVERVLSVMQSPVLAFDIEGRLRLINSAAEQLFQISTQTSLGQSAEELKLSAIFDAADDKPISIQGSSGASRWIAKKTSFRLRGVPHTLLVLAEVGSVLREQERQAWRRLIRVMGHEINNSLTPIKSIAGSLRSRMHLLSETKVQADMERGLSVIEDRSESLNRFLQAYRQLSGMPSPRLVSTDLSRLIHRVVHLETRVPVTLVSGPAIEVMLDEDQIQQALINLLKNAAEAASDPASPSRERGDAPMVEVTWVVKKESVSILIRDN